MDEFESTEKHYVMVLSATDKQYQAPLSEIVSAAQDRQMFQYFPRLIDKHCTLLETLQVALENWRWVAAGVLAGVVFPSVCLSLYFVVWVSLSCSSGSARLHCAPFVLRCVWRLLLPHGMLACSMLLFL
jgi:hypothetical protein